MHMDGARRIAAEILVMAIEDWRRFSGVPYRKKKTRLELYYPMMGFKTHREELKAFFDGEYFEALAEGLGVSPDVIRESLGMLR